MIEIVSCTPEDLADAFALWERRHPRGPALFTPAPPLPPEEYGAACAPYFRRLLEEAGLMSGDPLRRALALGWRPPAAGYEPFWFHPEHGPVHEEDLPGVLAEEAEAPPSGAIGAPRTEHQAAEARAPSTRPADYLKAALARLNAAAEARGFEVREVTLFFYEDEAEVSLKVELRIEAALLDLAPAQSGAIGAPRPKSSRVLPDEEN